MLDVTDTDFNWGDREFSPRTVDWNTYLGFSDNPVQRDTDAKIEEDSFKKKMRTYHPTHRVIYTGVIAQEFIHPTDANKTYKVGEEVLGDGHSRRLWYENNPHSKPKDFLCLSIPINNWEELVMLYRLFDSPFDVEDSEDRIFGAARAVLRPLGVSLKDKRLLKSSPYEYAANLVYPDEFKRGETSTNHTAVTLIKYFKDAIIWLQDEVFADSSMGKKQKLNNVIITALLASYYRYAHEPSKLALVKEWVIKVSGDKTNHDPDDGKYNAVTLFLDGWKTINDDRQVYCLGSGILQTNFRSEVSEGFVLLHIDKYVAGETNKRQTHPDYMKVEKKSYRNKWQEDMGDILLTKKRSEALESAFNITTTEASKLSL